MIDCIDYMELSVRLGNEFGGMRRVSRQAAHKAIADDLETTLEMPASDAATAAEIDRATDRLMVWLANPPPDEDGDPAAIERHIAWQRSML